MVKKICVGLCCFLAVFTLAGCYTSRRDYTAVRVYVKDEYSGKFDAMEFITEDFEWDNIKDFSYHCFLIGWKPNSYEDCSIERRFFKINLEIAGKEHAENAIEHFSRLGFVKYADYAVYNADPGWTLEEAKEKVQERSQEK